MMNNCNSNSYSSRNRRGLKQPVYTSDKRAKFTQRENKKGHTIIGISYVLRKTNLQPISFQYDCEDKICNMNLLFSHSSALEYHAPNLLVTDKEKWIRFLTVLGYIFFVSLPAISFSVYYVYVWDPGYITKLPHNETAEQVFPAKYFDTIKSDKKPRDVNAALPDITPSTVQLEPHLEQILREGKASMESSAEYRSVQEGG